MHAFSEQFLAAVDKSTVVDRAMAQLPADAAEVMAIQRQNIDALGGPGGWKVTPWIEGVPMSTAPIPARWIRPSGATIPMVEGLLLEVELALSRTADGNYLLLPVFELVLRRLDPKSDWPELAKQAGLMSTDGMVLGTPRPMPSADIAELPIVLTQGDGSQVRINTPLDRTALLKAAEFVTDYATQLGHPLQAGTVVTTGARIGPIPVLSGRTSVDMADLGTVEFQTA
ncbi:MAG: hypothetical protein KIT02_08785 [Devosia sp.]|uniref:hypothetical protein n=1 Tax=Devosia sp. TaxID=1871048 RepID=UPI0024C519D0|nr:hypothetical protein [Devosia sp.]UYN98082.1 MAG: hypothetical protein KIT02_08785 [Devosia sp.]